MGENNHRPHLPEGIPAEYFRAATRYDAPTAAGADRPGPPNPYINSQSKLNNNADDSIDLYLGPALA